MIFDETALALCLGFVCLATWMASMEIRIWLESRRPKPELTPDDMRRCQTWLDMKAQPRIPSGTPAHVFTDIPDDDLLTSRAGHPYT